MKHHRTMGDAIGYAMATNARAAAETAAADRLVAEARRDVHESLAFLSAPEADRVRALIADLETAVEGRTAIRDAARTATDRQTGACGCGQPATPDVVHRQDGPCYMDQDGGLQTMELPYRAARQTGQQPDETAVACHPHGYAGECPHPPNSRCCKVAPADPTTADDPTPLRWGLGDVLHGDDNTVTVCLSGPDGERYWLELEPERAQALRDDLTPPGNCPQCDDTRACNGGPCAHPAAGLDASQPATDQARPPREQWHVEGYDAGEWNPCTGRHPTRDAALRGRESLHRRYPDMPTRVVRETTTWTVEETDQ